MNISNFKYSLVSRCSFFHFFTSTLNVLVVVSAPAESIMIKEVEQYKVKSGQQANSNIKSDKNICKEQKVNEKGVNERHTYIYTILYAKLTV